MLTDIQARYRDQIDSSFHAALFEQADTKDSNLREMIRYHYDTGGKRIRPLCVALAAEKEWSMHDIDSSSKSAPANSERMAKVMPFAVAVEMIHNATLIHDDLQDGDEFRRSQPTLWKRFSPEQAINCGDLLFFTALRRVQNGGYSAETSLALQALLAEKTEHVIEGQGEEFRIKQALQSDRVLPSLADYERMVLGKTGALFSMPLLGGAIIAGASQESLNQLAKGAAALGFAFQIQDDYIDIWGEKGRDQRATDIAEGKLSFPVITALEQFRTQSISTEDQGRFVEIIAKDRDATTSADIEWAVSFMESHEVHKIVQNKFYSFVDEFSAAGYWQEVLQSLYNRIAEKMR